MFTHWPDLSNGETIVLILGATTLAFSLFMVSRCKRKQNKTK